MPAADAGIPRLGCTSPRPPSDAAPTPDAGAGSANASAAASTIEDARCRAALGDAFVIWLKAAPPVLATRAQSSRHRPLDTDAVAQLEAQARRRAPLFAAVADQVVDVT